jgi:flavin reductase (DIM6/NTAB) family NADH-FMN oxidoreductase RutF
MLVDAAASFECRLEDAREYGTHTVLVGSVCHVETNNAHEAMLYAGGAIARAQAIGA